MQVSGNELRAAERELSEYYENRPNKQVLELYSTMSRDKFIQTYGADALYSIDRIVVQDSMATGRMEMAINRARMEYQSRQWLPAALMLYLIVLQLGWAWPLSNKINAGEWTWKRTHKTK